MNDAGIKNITKNSKDPIAPLVENEQTLVMKASSFYFFRIDMSIWHFIIACSQKAEVFAVKSPTHWPSMQSQQDLSFHECGDQGGIANRWRENLMRWVPGSVVDRNASGILF